MLGICFSVCLIIFTVPLSAEERFLINGTNVNLREKPSVKSKVIHILNNEDELLILQYESKWENITGIDDRWVKVNYQNKVGFIFSAFLKPFEFKNKLYISIEKAQSCCYKICRAEIAKANCSKKPNYPDCDCGEACEGGGPPSMLEYGWTPDLEDKKRYFQSHKDVQTNFRQYNEQCLLK
ncbi:SH3 domain-containing protein [Leptospira langatensis]|uniref:SH3 domain-containing protein n=1 Tax=Leptospira langatensis TaxID=2484983 RepID=A0A5F1ZQE8_9LEPT|nr:SH3 domain-containing protein [Leptospira langatensis]TGK01987.1 SH3 domain-containing protein [Leptospira langatensis]TGL39540.1 SH3 domain-containing protein [Leptospira langatensis]